MTAEIREIAERAGLGVGTIYRNFASKDDLITEIVRDKLVATLAEIRRLEALEDSLEALQLILTEELSLVEYLGELSEALSAPTPRNLVRNLPDEWEEFRRAEPFEALIRRSVQQGGLRPDLDIPTAAAMLAGLVLNRNWRPLLAERKPRELAHAAFDAFLRGAANQQEAPQVRNG
jgi:AcrR family transcriptional regulator